MKSSARILDQVLNKLGGNQTEAELHDLLDSLMRPYLDKVHYKQKQKPVGKNNYVGIEVECFSHLGEKGVMRLLLAHNLEKYVDISDDGSIDTDDGEESYELRILVTEKELSSVLKRLGAFFKAGKFQVNDSCGLHVHLDMRNRDFEKCYEKLVKFQDIMFGMVNTDRWESDYCQWSHALNKSERFTAVNRLAYARHKTIEVRLHHGTVDCKRIENWVKLLIKAISSKPVEEVKSKKDVLKWAGRNKKLKSFLNKGFNKNWFVEKSDVTGEESEWEPRLSGPMPINEGYF